MSYIKFDGIEVKGNQTYLIDAKSNIPYWNRSAMNTTFKNTLDRIANAKTQNPNIKVVYEFPNNEAKSKMKDWISKNEAFEDVIDITRVRGEK